MKFIKQVITFSALFSFLFISSIVRAEDETDLGDDLIYKNADLITSVPSDFLGALLVCNPYCEVIAQRLGNEWKPDLATVRITSTKYKLLDIDDPLYKALFPENLAEVEALQELIKNSESTPVEGVLSERRMRFVKYSDREEVGKGPFDNGFRVSPEIRYTQLSSLSSALVQNEFKPKSGVMNAAIGFGYMRGKPISFLRKWWQFEAGYKRDLYAAVVQLENSNTLNMTQSEIYLLPWIKEKKFTWGVKYRQLTMNYKLGTNSLQSFSFNEVNTFLGLVLKTGRYRWDIDYAIQQKIKEEQPFRDQLTAASVIMLKGSYCQTRKMVYSSVFSPCYGISYIQSSNKATYDAQFGSQNEAVQLKRQEMALSVILHFGEDFQR